MRAFLWCGLMATKMLSIKFKNPLVENKIVPKTSFWLARKRKGTTFTATKLPIDRKKKNSNNNSKK